MYTSITHLGPKTWEPCEVASPNFHVLNGRDCTDWPHATRGLGFGTPCEPGLSTTLCEHQNQGQ